MAQLLGYTTKGLTYVVYGIPEEHRYSSFQIPKKSGGYREILSPALELKALQRKLSDALQNIVTLAGQGTPFTNPNCHGFTPKRSILTNAKRHRNQRYVFNIDLSDFFGSINFGRIHGFLQKNKHFALSREVATIIAQAACHKNKLPQGSPCSPILSNLIASTLDSRLGRLASKHRCSYTRYADDITFSTSMPEFPKEIALLEDGKWSAGNDLRTVIEKSGFRINNEKTRMQFRSSRQSVTGLIVNKKVNTPSDYRRRVRAMLQRYLKHGEAYSGGDTSSIVGTNQIHGMLSHIHTVSQRASCAPSHSRVNPTDFKKFLFCKIFGENKNPVILCEGKTDHRYISAAILKYADKFPELAYTASNGKKALIPKFYKYPDSSTSKVLELRGGAGDLKRFLAQYRILFDAINFERNINPVIIIVDNDPAGIEVLSAARQMRGEKCDRDADIIYLSRNLYIATIPRNNKSKDYQIEDLFKESTLGLDIFGKTLCLDDSKFNSEVNFGKEIFSSHIAQNYSEIDFENFLPLLESIKMAIGDLRNRLSATTPQT